MKEIRIYEPDIGLKEIYYASRTIFNGWLGYGKSVKNFKEKICTKLKLDISKSVITESATDGLFILFKTLSIQGEVIVPSISYSGISNAIINAGSKITFCDVEEDLNPSVHNVKKVYNKNCKAVVINNYGGVQTEELYKIKSFCKEKNMMLIEDRASNLIGGKSNHLADFVIYSFNNTKMLTTIEGGMIYINNNKYIKYLEKLQLHTFLGKKKNLLTNNFNYEQNEDVYLAGNKSTMSSVGAEIGIAQIDKLNLMVEKRLENELLYFKELEHDFHVPKINAYPKSWYWIRTGKENKQKIIQKMIANNININFKYYPLHMTSLYKKNNVDLNKSEELYNQIVCLPIHSKLKKEEIKEICDILKRP